MAPDDDRRDKADPAAFVRVSRLSKRFGGYPALTDVSIATGEGSTLALLGPSGCGKTTMLRCIAGLETPEAGVIEIAGRPVFDAARGIDMMPERRDLGVVFQSYAIWPHLSVAANVGFPLKVRGVSRGAIAERVEKILSMVGLGGWGGRAATDLSGGQQQRVALARALVHEPRLVLFDEPMSNLDAQLRDQMRLELKLLQQQLGFTAIYVTHDQAEAFGLAQTVVVMNRGRVEAVGTPRQVVQRPKTPFIAGFLGYNVLEGTVAAVDGNHVQIALPGDMRVWALAGTNAPCEPRAPAVLCVRREHVRLAGAGASPHDKAQRFAGRLRASSFQGLYQEYIVDIAGIELRAVGAPIEEGDDVTVMLDRDECLVLPPDRNAEGATPSAPEGRVG